MNTKTTYWTAMQSVGQLLMNGCSAPIAPLACTARVDLNQLSTSICSFVLKHNKEHSPRYVVHGFSKHSSRHSPNLQVFDTYYIIGLDDFGSCFMQKVITPISDYFVLFCQQPNRLHSMDTALLFPINTTLKNPEFALADPVISWIINKPSVGSGCKTFQTHVNTNRFMGFWKRIGFNLAGKQCIVFSVFSGNTHGLDLSIHRPMQTNSDFTYPLKINPIPVQFTPISVRSIGDGVILCDVLKPWKPSFFSALNPVEKGLIGPIYLSKYVLTGRKVGQLANIVRPDLFQFGCLHIIANVLFCSSVCPNPMLQCGVIQTPGFCQLIRNRLNLTTRGVQSIFKRFYHSIIAIINISQSYKIIDYRPNLFIKKTKVRFLAVTSVFI